MHKDFDKDIFLLFNMVFDELDKIDLKSGGKDSDLEDVVSYLRDYEDKPKIAIINTNNKEYQKSLLFRKMVDGKAVIFAFWKRGMVCEGMVASSDGVSVLNEFMWVQDHKTGKFKASLQPKKNIGTKKERQAQITRVGIVSALIEPLNRTGYREKFGGDVLKKLETQRQEILQGLKDRSLVPTDFSDPIERKETVEISAKAMLNEKDEKHSTFVGVQKDGRIVPRTLTVSDSEDLNKKLLESFEREARLADIQEERDKKKEN
jgi:hypothetical protein